MNYYFNTGDRSPEFRYQRWDATTTLAIWTPRTGNRFVVTDLTVSPWGSVAAGTFSLFLGTTNGAPPRICEFGLAGSAVIRPLGTTFESTGVNYILYGRPSAGGTGSHHVYVEGFELGEN